MEGVVEGFRVEEEAGLEAVGPTETEGGSFGTSGMSWDPASPGAGVEEVAGAGTDTGIGVGVWRAVDVLRGVVTRGGKPGVGTAGTIP